MAHRQSLTASLDYISKAEQGYTVAPAPPPAASYLAIRGCLLLTRRTLARQTSAQQAGRHISRGLADILIALERSGRVQPLPHEHGEGLGQRSKEVDS